MQAVLALCHFCENHGPRVLMTTQSVPESLRQDYCIPTTSKASSTFLLSRSFRSHFVDEPRCVACTSFVDGAGLITSDVTAQISYISTQVALNDRVYQLVKHACLHSLSCEVATTAANSPKVSPTKPRATKTTAAQNTTNWEEPWAEANTEADDGVILFGDDEHGYTLSHTFRLRDRKARGFLRLFSLVLTCMDKLLITSNYDFFVSTMSSIIRRLQVTIVPKTAAFILSSDLALLFQKKSDTVFGIEQSDTSDEALKQATASRASLLPAHFLRTRVTKLELDTSRSLTQITGCADIFTKLHKYMTWLLRTQTRLCTEYLLEGVPTQDMLVMKEREQDATEEAEPACAGSSRRLDCVATLRQIAKMLEDMPKANHQSVLDLVLTQLVTGGQIVLKCQDAVVAKRFLLALSNLLPLGCIRLAYAEEYQHVFAANLFGCPLNTVLSPDAIDIVVLLLNVPFGCIHSKPMEEPPACSLSSEGCISPPLSTSSKEDNTDESLAKRLVEVLPPRKPFDFEDYAFTLAAYPNCTAPKYDTPTIVKRYKQIILDNDLSCRALAAVIRNIREQWLNKAKLVYQLGRQKESIDLKKVLQITRCADQDATVLLFFQAGLSKTYKQQIMDVISKGAAQIA